MNAAIAAVMVVVAVAVPAATAEAAAAATAGEKSTNEHRWAITNRFTTTAILRSATKLPRLIAPLLLLLLLAFLPQLTLRCRSRSDRIITKMLDATMVMEM